MLTSESLVISTEKKKSASGLTFTVNAIPLFAMKELSSNFFHLAIVKKSLV